MATTAKYGAFKYGQGYLYGMNIIEVIKHIFLKSPVVNIRMKRHVQLLKLPARVVDIRSRRP